MLAQGSIPIFSYLQQRVIVFVGVATVLTLGLVACIGLTLALLWLVVRLALLTLQGSIETLNAIGATYASADPTVKLLVLVATSYVLYRAYRKLAGKR